MGRRSLAALAVAGVVVAGYVAVANADGSNMVRSRLDGTRAEVYTARPGTPCAVRGSWVIRPEGVPISECTATVTPTTITVTTTTVAPTTTTVAPTTAGFVETFANNAGLNRLTYGVYHRGVGKQTVGEAPEIWGTSGAWGDGTHAWTGDHDVACGNPDTQRPLSSTHQNLRTAELAYVCNNHLMTSMGDVDGYSIVWFAPDANSDRVADTFTADSVSWDVNITDLGGRQWWEVSIIPVGAEFLATSDWLAPVAGIATYDRRSVVVGNGPAGGDINITTGGVQRYTNDLRSCGGYAYNPTACQSKMTRLPFKIVDNNNGTITVNFGGLFTQTVPGEFPPGGFRVYFKDHNYTPDKDGPVVGHTWHWGNLRVG